MITLILTEFFLCLITNNNLKVVLFDSKNGANTCIVTFYRIL